MTRRILLMLAISAFLIPASTRVLAQTYPDKAIRMLVPFVAGGGTDQITRIVMKKMGESMGQAIVIENKGGAGGMIAYGEVARSAPDGYTLTVGGPGLGLRGLIYDKLPFNLETSLVSVAPMASVPVALVASNASGFKSVGDLLAAAKKKPSAPISYGSPGVGTPHHLAGVLLASAAGISLEHVPYKGSAAALQDVAGGQISLAVVGLSSALSHEAAGQLKILGVGSAKRSRLAPSTPTIDESGVKGYEAGYLYDVTVARGTPKSVVDRLQAEITSAIQSPDVSDALVKAGFEPMLISQAEYQRLIQREVAKWGKLIREHNIRAAN